MISATATQILKYLTKEHVVPDSIVKKFFGWDPDCESALDDLLAKNLMDCRWVSDGQEEQHLYVYWPTEQGRKFLVESRKH